MKKAITTLSLIITMFVLAVFVAPKQSEAGFDITFGLGIGYSSGYDSSYDNYGYDNYGYDNYGYDNYSGYDNYGYDNYGYDNYGYNDYGYPYSYNNGYGYGGYMQDYGVISPTGQYSMVPTYENGYIPVANQYNSYGYYGNGGYDSHGHVCFTNASC